MPRGERRPRSGGADRTPAIGRPARIYSLLGTGLRRQERSCRCHATPKRAPKSTASSAISRAVLATLGEQETIGWLVQKVIHGTAIGKREGARGETCRVACIIW